MTKQTNGYILIVTLLMIASMTAIGTYIYLRSTVFFPFARTVYEREKAKELALGGLQIAIRQLSQFDETDSEQATAGQPAKSKQEAGGPQQLFARLIPIINRWQPFALQKKIDGIDGSIQVCIACEEGKININRIYDFDKGAFKGSDSAKASTDTARQQKGDWQKLMALVCKEIEQALGGKELLPALENFLKGRKYPLYDVTELLTIKEFAVFRNHIFYDPSAKKTDDKATIYLTDLFTTFSDKNTIEPRLFSHSMLSILKLTQTPSAEQIATVEKNFKPTVQWPTDWDTQLKPLYAKDFQSLFTGLDAVLSTQFNPQQFSVLVSGTVGAVTQRLLAIVKRNKRAAQGETRYNTVISRIYWL